MPPWQAEDGFGDFKNGHALTATEMDIILEWSSGGYPQGPLALTPVAESLVAEWTFSEPALVLKVPETFTLDADTSETVRYFVLPSRLSEKRIILGAELKPGARAVVRGAAIFVDSTGMASSLDDADATRRALARPPTWSFSPPRPWRSGHQDSRRS